MASPSTRPSTRPARRPPAGTRQTALITGTSSGFGRDIAVTLAARGWHVLATMREPGRREGLDAAARAAGPANGTITVAPLDVASADSRREAAETAIRTLGGPPDLLLHNAGYTTAGFFEDLSSDEQDRLVRTNLTGPLELTRLLLPGMRERGSGRIGVMSSNAVNVPHPMYSVYAATKWALEGWSEALAIEVAPFGLDVVVFQPGNHGTDFGSNVVPVLPAESAYREIADHTVPRMTRLGRYARSPEKAVTRICDVLERDRAPFRVRLGADDHIAHLLARFAPYAVRRRGVERITGITR